MLVSCAVEDSPVAVPSGPTCQFEAPAVPEIKFSTAPHRLQIPLDQQKLVEFMWLAASERDCYLAHQGVVHIARIETNAEDKTEDLAALPLASGVLLQNWKNFQNEFEAPLMGLTTYTYSTGENENLVETDIVIKDSARPRDLWHEYAHFLVAKARATDLLETLVIPHAGDLNGVEDHREYIKKVFLDEIAIEAAITEIASQHREDLGIEGADLRRSLRVARFFMRRYKAFYTSMQSNPTMTVGFESQYKEAIQVVDEIRRAINVN